MIHASCDIFCLIFVIIFVIAKVGMPVNKELKFISILSYNKYWQLAVVVLATIRLQYKEIFLVIGEGIDFLIKNPL